VSPSHQEDIDHHINTKESHTAVPLWDLDSSFHKIHSDQFVRQVILHSHLLDCVHSLIHDPNHVDSIRKEVELVEILQVPLSMMTWYLRAVQIVDQEFYSLRFVVFPVKFSVFGFLEGSLKSLLELLAAFAHTLLVYDVLLALDSDEDADELLAEVSTFPVSIDNNVQNSHQKVEHTGQEAVRSSVLH